MEIRMDGWELCICKWFAISTACLQGKNTVQFGIFIQIPSNDTPFCPTLILNHIRPGIRVIRYFGCETDFPFWCDMFSFFCINFLFSSYPSQVNNMYTFPAIGLAAVTCRAKNITDSMLYAASRTLADSVKEEGKKPKKNKLISHIRCWLLDHRSERLITLRLSSRLSHLICLICFLSPTPCFFRRYRCWSYFSRSQHKSSHTLSLLCWRQFCLCGAFNRKKHTNILLLTNKQQEVGVRELFMGDLLSPKNQHRLFPSYHLWISGILHSVWMGFLFVCLFFASLFFLNKTNVL